MASPMQVATATVVRWTEGQPEPSSHNVKALTAAGVSPTDLTTILAMAFLTDELERLEKQEDFQKLNAADKRASALKLLRDLVEEGRKGFLQVLQPPNTTPLTQPAQWQA